MKFGKVKPILRINPCTPPTRNVGEKGVKNYHNESWKEISHFSLFSLKFGSTNLDAWGEQGGMVGS